ncbi:phosphate:H+ symporter [Martensiomyces pterosporus]|nr:phosphate:H+ symporter [Martensiomyces pterosporus]
MIRSFLVCGAAFFADAYLLFSSNIIVMIMGYVYFHEAPGTERNVVPNKWSTLVKVAVQVGCLLGQLILGRLGDKFGRTSVFSMGAILVIISTVGASFSSDTVRGFNVFIFLFIWLVFVGIGVGGDYPLAATITSEYANVETRGKVMSAVFACQGFGNLGASIVAIIVLACFKSSIRHDVYMLDYVWRICLGFGAIPGAVTLYWRLTMPESKRFQAEAKRRIAVEEAHDAENELLLAKEAAARTSESAGSPSSSGRMPDAQARSQPASFSEYFSKWRNLKVLLGTAIAWFVLDVAFYGINLNSSVVISAIGFSGDVQHDDPYDVLSRNCLGNIIINLLGSVPGYWITVFTIEKLGRKKIQLLGFAALTVLYVVIGFAYHQILDRSNVAFIVLFTLAQLFQNFGPNVTCFVWPGEVFPTRFRATAHGVSAAAGKLGAIVAQAGLMTLKDRGGPNAFIPHLIEIFALFTLIGFLVTFWIPETKGRTLEEITGEE